MEPTNDPQVRAEMAIEELRRAIHHLRRHTLVIAKSDDLVFDVNGLGLDLNNWLDVDLADAIEPAHAAA